MGAAGTLLRPDKMGGPGCARGGATLLALSQMPAADKKLEEEVYTEKEVGAIIGVLESQK